MYFCLFPGSVKCQWKTVAGTAKSPEDFIDTTGAVEFASGSRNSTINITIIDNNISELEKTFTVELFNAEGGGMFSKSIYYTLLSAVRYIKYRLPFRLVGVQNICCTIKS